MADVSINLWYVRTGAVFCTSHRTRHTSSIEKEQARAMIHTALRGFEESERTSVDLDSLSTLAIHKNREKQMPQGFLKADALNRSYLQSIKEEDSIDSSVRVPVQSETTYSQSYGNFHTPVQPPLLDNTTEWAESLQVNEDSLDHDDNAKSRQIRELKSKLSRQEEESKRQLNDMQAKQVRLENALKLLVQQSVARDKSHLPTVDRKAPLEKARFYAKKKERNASSNLTRPLCRLHSSLSLSRSTEIQVHGCTVETGHIHRSFVLKST